MASTFDDMEKRSPTECRPLRQATATGPCTATHRRPPSTEQGGPTTWLGGWLPWAYWGREVQRTSVHCTTAGIAWPVLNQSTVGGSSEATGYRGVVSEVRSLFQPLKSGAI